jgi:hypothetical protein
MKDLIGTKVQFLVEGGVKVEGVVVADRPDRVMVKTSDKKIVRIIKSRVSLFIPEKEPEEFIILQLLYCHNSETKCPGVQYVVEGEKLTRPMFAAFMEPCPMKQDSCRCGTKGDLRTISSATLKQTMCGMLFGDYPEAAKEKRSERPKRKNEAPAGSPEEG